jgi:hypothetical protein
MCRMEPGKAELVSMRMAVAPRLSCQLTALLPLIEHSTSSGFISTAIECLGDSPGPTPPCPSYSSAACRWATRPETSFWLAHRRRAQSTSRP